MKSPYICNLPRALYSRYLIHITWGSSEKRASLHTTTTMITTTQVDIRDKEHRKNETTTTCIHLRDLCSYLSRLILSQFCVIRVPPHGTPLPPPLLGDPPLLEVSIKKTDPPPCSDGGRSQAVPFPPSLLVFACSFRPSARWYYHPISRNTLSR